MVVKKILHLEKAKQSVIFSRNKTVISMINKNYPIHHK